MMKISHDNVMIKNLYLSKGYHAWRRSPTNLVSVLS